jgi:cytochrome c oxidase cbb3-type subunit III
MSRGRRAAAAAALAVVALAAAGCDVLFPKRSLGERVWRQRCAECHGLDAAGNTVRYMGDANADLTDDIWVHGDDDASIETVVRQGVVGDMPPFPMLSDPEVKAVIAYLHELRGDSPGPAARR